MVGVPLGITLLLKIYDLLALLSIIVGAGAVGLFYGSRLHQPKHNVSVSLICRSNYEAVKNHGVKLLTHSYGEYVFRPEAVFKSATEAASANNGDAIWDYVVVTTKALPRDSGSGANLIKPVVRPQTTIVLIQNGIGIEEPYREAFPNNVLLSAVTVISAEQIEQGVVRQNRWTRISIGPFTGGKGVPNKGGEKTKEFVKLLKDGGVKDAEEYDESGLQFVRWHKIAVSRIQPLLTIEALIGFSPDKRFFQPIISAVKWSSK